LSGKIEGRKYTCKPLQGDYCQVRLREGNTKTFVQNPDIPMSLKVVFKPEIIVNDLW
jgi:hypothetical protein